MSLVEGVIEALAGLPPQAVVVLIATLPFIELRGAIPVAIGIYHMNIYEAFAWAFIGNMLPVPFILLLFGRLEGWLRRWAWWDRFFNKLFRRTRGRAKASVERYEELGIILFVAIPLPFTGAWTGSLIAYLFGLDYRKSTMTIALGVCIAGVIVTAATLGIISML